uniref:Polyprotein n=1 Tax=Cajanus cajan TaxID=3821 RepID=A0A151RPG4_CAJCA|nr:polyprotein [Cajanus cajan]
MFSCKSSNPGSSSLSEKQFKPQSSNVFNEEFCFEDHNQELDDWQLPKVSANEIYKLDGRWFKQTDYIIKTAESQIPLSNEEEEFHLLDEQSLKEEAKKYNYLHIGCIQVAIKPLGIKGLDNSILCCLRDLRHLRFNQSLIGTVETSLAKGPIFFNCFPNRTISLKDRNILDALYLQIQTKDLHMKPGSIRLTLIYRIQYKVMNSIRSKVYKPLEVGTTTLFLTDFSKANVVVPVSIKWEDVTLPDS